MGAAEPRADNASGNTNGADTSPNGEEEDGEEGNDKEEGAAQNATGEDTPTATEPDKNMRGGRREG